MQKGLFTLFEELEAKTSSVLAKSDPAIPLARHMADTLYVLQDYLDVNFPLLASKFPDITPERLKEALVFIVYFHDIGKATVEFQNTLRDGSKSYHPFYSAMQIYRSPLQIHQLDIPLLAILNHHSIYFQDSQGMLYLNVSINDVSFIDEIRHFLDFYPRVCQDIFRLTPTWVPPEKPASSKIIKGFLFNLSARINNLGMNPEVGTLIKQLFIVLSGTLVFCDRMASAGEYDPESSPPYRFSSSHSVKQTLEQSISDFKGWKNFQREAAQTTGSVFIEIPTGEGKTEAALLWAQQNLRNHFTRICYTLPTRVTSNKMYERLRTTFPRGYVALIHSSAKLKLEEQFPEDASQKLHLWYALFNTFSLPVSVSTLDAVLTRYLHVGRWDAARLNLENALLIVDEIHAYNPKLMGFLLHVLEYQQQNGNPFALMSASFPEVLRRKFEERLLFKTIGNSQQESELWKKSPGEVVKQPHSILEAIPRMVSELNKGRKVLCVSNTIRDAKKLYQLLQEEGIPREKLLLYHSEFTQQDRGLKETEIYYRLGKQPFRSISYRTLEKQIYLNREFLPFGSYLQSLIPEQPFILIATQVVEISLDIDFDILFTEIAPIDAIVQRIGRVNRKKCSERAAQYIIFSEVDSGENGWFYPYEKEFLDASWEVMSEGPFTIADLKHWVNMVYSEENTFKRSWYAASFESGFALFDKITKVLHVISKNNLIEEQAEEFMLREIEKRQRKIAVIPVIFWETLDLLHQPIQRRLEHAIEISAYKQFVFHGILEIPNGYGLRILAEKEYDYCFGVDWHEEASLFI